MFQISIPCLIRKLYPVAQEKLLYVLDGLLKNNTISSIKDHTTDTEGYNEHILVYVTCLVLILRQA